jgi:hypothetical protein
MISEPNDMTQCKSFGQDTADSLLPQRSTLGQDPGALIVYSLDMNIVMNLLKALLGNSSVNTFQHTPRNNTVVLGSSQRANRPAG